MGNCCGRPQIDDKRVQTWKQTGLVSLRDQDLRSVPAEVARAADKAKVLDLSFNRLTQIPDALFLQLVNIQRLNLSNNTLSNIPQTIGSCLQLRQLFLDSNQLSSLPEELCSLPRLEKLTLHNNTLRHLPAALGKLNDLKSLTVNNNSLESLPEFLSACSSLQELNAADNQLAAIPPSFSGLKKLRVLQLDNNKICKLPQALLTGCSSLQSLSLHGNPITPETLHATPGFNEYETRRRSKFDKAIAGSAMLDSRGLDEGIDRQTLPRGNGA
jgi:Leucine-rich repeat (LRR) protein